MAVSNLIERFREAARARGIDPVNGSTVYQAANVQADLEFKKKRAAAGMRSLDWLTWENDTISDTVNRPTEIEALKNLQQQMRRRPDPILIGTAYINEGLRAKGLADLPLKELHELQRTLQKQKRERVKWVPGAGGVPQRINVGAFA